MCQLAFRISPHHDFCLFLFHLLLHLIFRLLFSLSVFFLCLPCDVVCVVACGCVVCVVWCVVLCGVVWCVCGVCGVCCAAWHAEKPPCVDSKRLCVDSKRPRVCWQHAHMLDNMCACCQHTRGRFESTYGGVLNLHTGSSPVLLTKKSPRTVLTGPREVHQKNERIVPIFLSLREGRQQHVPDSSNHSLYLMKLFNSSSPEGNCGENQLWDGSICLSHLLASSVLFIF